MLSSRKIVPILPASPTAGKELLKPSIPILGGKAVEKQDELLEELELLQETATIEIEVDDLASVQDREAIGSGIEEPALPEDENAFIGGLELKGDLYDKYRKMLKCGLSIGAVEHKMRQDGISSLSKMNAEVLHSSELPSSSSLRTFEDEIRHGNPRSSTKMAEKANTDEKTGASEEEPRIVIKPTTEEMPQGDGNNVIKQVEIDIMHEIEQESIEINSPESSSLNEPKDVADNFSTEKEKQFANTTESNSCQSEVIADSVTQEVSPNVDTPSQAVELEKPEAAGDANEERATTSEARALFAEAWVKKELAKLISEIRSIGKEENGVVSVTFGELFKRYQDVSDSLVGILIRAKKRGLVEYPGEMLYQGKDDLVTIRLDAVNAEAFSKGIKTVRKPSQERDSRTLPKPLLMAKKPVDNVKSSPTSKADMEATGSSTSVEVLSSVPSTSSTIDEIKPMDEPPTEDNNVGTATIAAPNPVLSQDAFDVIDVQKPAPIVIPSDTPITLVKGLVFNDEYAKKDENADAASPLPSPPPRLSGAKPKEEPSEVTGRGPPEPLLEESPEVTGRGPPPEPQHEISSKGAGTEPLPEPLLQESPEGTGEESSPKSQLQESFEVTTTNSPPESEVTGRGPPPVPQLQEPSGMTGRGSPPVPQLQEPVEVSEEVTGRGPPPLPPSTTDEDISPSAENRRRMTSSILNKPRASRTSSRRSTTSSQIHTESMFDENGRRRSSGTVYRVALNLMEARDISTIPRDDITDALNWTQNGDEDKDIFSFENTEGLELGRVLEHLNSKSPSGIKRGSSTNSMRVRNQVGAAMLIQRVMRGWMTRIKYRSCVWVRDRLNSAVRSRLPEKVEEALAASRAISRFVRVPEHERAVASLDTIREERAIRPKLVELAEARVDVKNANKKYASVIERMNRCRASDPFAFRDEISVKAELVYEAMLQREVMYSKLQSACDRMCPAEMMKALQACDAASAKFVGIWEDNFMEKEKNHIRKLLVAMQHEEPAIVGLLKECSSEGIFPSNEDTILHRANLENLENAIAKAVEDLGIHPASPGAAQILALGSAIFELRKALVFQSNQKQSSWATAEKLLGEARARLAAWIECIPRVAQGGSEYFSSWVQAIQTELDLISTELDKKAGVHDLIEALYDSVRRCDLDDIRNVLRKGEKRGLQERTHDVQLQQTLEKAKSYLERFSLIHSRLAEALSGVNRKPAELKKVAEEAKAIVLPDSTDSHLVRECERLCAFAESELVPLLNRTVEMVPEREEMEQVVERVRKTERLGGMPELAAVENLLALGEMRLIQEQLRATSRLHDEQRRNKLTVKVRELHLEQAPAMFRLMNFSDLKDSKEWAIEYSSKRIFPGMMGKRDAKAARMLYSSRTPIHSPLTRAADVDIKVKRFAIKANRTLLAYTGDLDDDDLTEFGGDVCQGLHELLVFALGEVRIRDEIYVQIMKHLTENNRPGSETRAWNFLAFCLVTFPPSACLDLFLEYFIRNNAPAPDLDSLLEKLHHGITSGERPTAPTLSDIKSRQDDGGSVEGLGWKRI